MKDCDLRACVVCGESRAVVVREVPTKRTNRSISLYCCQGCFSFFNPSGYKEDEKQLRDDLDWNIGVIPRNEEYARSLFSKLKANHPSIGSVLEVGCGIGTALQIAEKEFEMQTQGFDVNSAAVAWGREKFGLNLSDEFWNAGMDIDADLITCISCLEHVEEPRGLLEEIAKRCLETNSVAFISVPFLEVHHWKYLDDPDPEASGTPFFDNDVHVTHFSVLGLVRAMRGFGLERFELMNSGWMGVLFFPENTMWGKLKAGRRFRKWEAGYRERLESVLKSSECPDCLAGLR